MIGQTISHYKILEKLGEGGMGVVYKAQDTKLDRLVALKFLPKQFSINEEEKKRFIHEAKAAASLDHPNICAVHEIDETEDGQMFIAMACYEGETLKDKIASHPMRITDAIDIVIQIAEGLNKAHQKHIVHRDIKSANIIITNEGIAKILDFGLAKLRGVTKLTKEGTTLGTVAYMSPEQASGETVDHRTDIWSLGVVLYEIISGQLPFKGDYEHAIVYSIMNEQPEPITGLRTGVPIELERIINKALAKDVSIRYQHVDDLMVDLRALKKNSNSEETISRKKTGPEISLKVSWKMFIMGGLLMVIIIIAGYYIFKGKPEPEAPVMKPGDKPSLAVVYFENKSGDKNLDNGKDARKRVSGKLDTTIGSNSKTKTDNRILSKKNKIFITTTEYNLGSKLILPQIQPVVKNYFLKNGFISVNNVSSAAFLVKITLQSREGSETFGLYSAFVDIVISLTEVKSSHEIYHNIISNVKGLDIDYEKAGLKAIKNSTAKIENLLSELIVNLQKEL